MLWCTTYFLHRRNPWQKRSSVTFSANIGSGQRASSPEFVTFTRHKLANLATRSHNEKGSSDLAVRLKRNELSLIGVIRFESLSFS
jgi:hypothetical protein